MKHCYATDPVTGEVFIVRNAQRCESVESVSAELNKLAEANRQLEIERDDYKAVVVAREAGYEIFQQDGRWWWTVHRMDCGRRGPFPHQFAAARSAIKHLKGEAEAKAAESLEENK